MPTPFYLSGSRTGLWQSIACQQNTTPDSYKGSNMHIFYNSTLAIVFSLINYKDLIDWLAIWRKFE